MKSDKIALLNIKESLVVFWKNILIVFDKFFDKYKEPKFYYQW